MPAFEDDAWDEEQWEAFLRDNDRRVDRYMELFFTFLRKHPRPPEADAEAIAAWKEQLRAFLRNKGWRRDDLILPFIWLDEDPSDDEHELLDLADEFIEADLDADDVPFDDLEHLPLYRHAFELTSEVLDWAHGLEGDLKDSNLVQFCSHVMQIPANIARGHGIGIDREGLGGNIACVKRGLNEANDALDLLRLMKSAPYMDAATYRAVYERVYEVRNAMGLYVQDLRARFDLGID